MDKRHITLFWAAGLGLLIAIIFTFVGRGSVNHWLIIESMLILIAGPMALLSLIVLLISRFFSPSLMRWLATFTQAIVLIILIQVLSLVSGKMVYIYDMRTAQKYCESLIPALEQYKTKHNIYPAELGMLEYEPTEPFPALLELGTFYNSSGDSFRFYLPDPASERSWYEYASKPRKWIQMKAQ